nr:MAG TPA: hypothetical protein [Caudoviricetes sp.]
MNIKKSGQCVSFTRRHTLSRDATTLKSDYFCIIYKKPSFFKCFVKIKFEKWRYFNGSKNELRQKWCSIL